MIDLRALSPVIPVFALIGIGFIFARWKRISLESITEFIVYLASPSLVFSSLSSKPLMATDLLVLLAGVIGFMSGVGVLVTIYSFVFRFHSRGFVLPALFINAGNMGLPLALFAFGDPGLQRASICFVIMSTLQNSLGIYLVSGDRGWREIFRLPLIYATALGLFVNVNQIQIPWSIFEPIRMLGFSTIPLMLVSLGYRLSSLKSITWGHSVAGALIRLLGGFASAYLTVTLLGIEGLNRQVILLYGALPSAVANFVFTEKYRQDPELAASIVVITTLLSLFTIPIVLSLIL